MLTYLLPLLGEGPQGGRHLPIPTISHQRLKTMTPPPSAAEVLCYYTYQAKLLVDWFCVLIHVFLAKSIEERVIGAFDALDRKQRIASWGPFN